MRDRLGKTVFTLAIVLAVTPLPAHLLGFSDLYWRIVTDLGDEPAYIALAVLLYTLVSPELGYCALLSLATSGWVNVLLKNTLMMPRPPPELWKVKVSGYGFPSGHAQTSAAFWGAVALKVKHSSVALLGAVVATLVAYSRVELRVHYVHDVVGGLAIGLASSAATLALVGKVGKHQSKLQASTLILYGLLVSLLYFVQLDPIFTRMGGVVAGLAAFPLIKERIPRTAPFSTRLLSFATGLAAAFLITRLASGWHPLLQLVAYAFAVVSVLVAPLLWKKFKEKK